MRTIAFAQLDDNNRTSASATLRSSASSHVESSSADASSVAKAEAGADPHGLLKALVGARRGAAHATKQRARLFGLGAGSSPNAPRGSARSQFVN